MTDTNINVDNVDILEGKGSSFSLKLSNFDGPLDFLLELVKINKIEIKDIFVSEITEQFMLYISQISTLDVDEASEYMAIAATLLEIKSRSLLPMLFDDEEEQTPERSLLKQLEEYKMFKEIVTELKDQETINRFYREPDSSVGTAVDVVGDSLNMDSFMKAFERFLTRAGSRSPKEKVSRAIVKETFSIIDRIEYVKSALAECGTVSFSELFHPTSTKLEVVVTFSAILEMLKSQVIVVVQNDLFEEFYITKCDGNNDVILEDTIDG